MGKGLKIYILKKLYIKNIKKYLIYNDFLSYFRRIKI
jgi:hypothetical protein